jgi:hypothetical protein
VILDALRRHIVAVAITALCGFAAGALAAVRIPDVYESSVTFTVHVARSEGAQASVMAAAIEAMLKEPEMRALIEHVAGRPLRQVAVVTAGRQAVELDVQGYGAPAVHDVARLIAATLPTALATEDQAARARITGQVNASMPQVVSSLAQPWYEVPLSVDQDPAPPRLLPQHPALGGLFAGAGGALVAIAGGARVSRRRRVTS